MPPAAPCRLFVIIARDAPVAVILRRGPSAWAHVIHWDSSTDRFEHGAWLKGRLYEERCDLSPDGELLLSFVHQGNRLGSAYTDSWTALSRPPWLHALALWPHGTTYGGGGRFVGTREIQVRHGSLTAHPSHLPPPGVAVSSGNPPVRASTEVVPGADWAGRDHAGHVVFTRAGALFRVVGEREVQLADFNGLRPEPAPAPLWARAYPAR